jgi:hypothetical protein
MEAKPGKQSKRIERTQSKRVQSLRRIMEPSPPELCVHLCYVMLLNAPLWRLVIAFNHKLHLCMNCGHLCLRRHIALAGWSNSLFPGPACDWLCCCNSIGERGLLAFYII